MQIREIDAREIGVMVSETVYLVSFWRPQKPPPGIDVCQEILGFETKTYQVTGAVDVCAVLDWANRCATTDWMYTLAAVVCTANGRARLYLAGLDPPRAGCSTENIELSSDGNDQADLRPTW